MTDRATLIEHVAKLMGAQTGTIGASTTTTAVLNGLVNTTGDNNAYGGQQYRLIFPLAPDEASKQTLIDTWVDLTGTATFATRTAFAAGETYILVARQDYTLAEFRDALAEALRKSKRSYRFAIPAIPGERSYSLQPLTWLNGAGDVDAVFMSNSPIMLHNEDFSLWADGPDAAPDSWVLAGSGGTVERTTTTQRGGYAAILTRAGADVTLTQTIPSGLTNYLTRGGNQASGNGPIRDGKWVTCSTANTARVGISDGVTTTWSDYHTGSGVPEWLEVSLTLTATQTALASVCQVANSNVSATFSGAVMLQSNGTIPTSLRNYGSSAYEPWRVVKNVRNVGGAPVVELQSLPGNQQIQVYCRRVFEQVTTDSQYIDDQYARVLEAGLAHFLLSNIKPGVDRTRYDRILSGDPAVRSDKGESGIWARFLENVTDLPVGAPLTRVTIGPV